MALDCGATFAKYMLCLSNFVFFLGGAVVLGVGIWLAADQSSFIILTRISDHPTLQQLNQPSVVEQGGYILIAAGAFVFILAFLGYCGAVKESRVLLILYGTFVGLVLIMEITAGTLAAMYKQEAEAEIKGFLRFTLQQYYTTKQRANAVSLAWDVMMGEMSCCGVNNYTDFSIASHWHANKTSGQIVPPACCKLVGDKAMLQPVDPSCLTAPTMSNSHFMTGCYAQVLGVLEMHMDLVIGIGIGLGLIQLLGLIFALCLCKAIDNDYIK